MNGAEDDLDFDFVVSYNNSNFMALHNAAPDKASTDPLRVSLGPFANCAESMLSPGC